MEVPWWCLGDAVGGAFEAHWELPLSYLGTALGGALYLCRYLGRYLGNFEVPEGAFQGTL